MTQVVHNVAAVGIRPETLETYLELHRQQPDAVRRAMQAANILSYRMFLLRSQNLVISVSSRDATTLAADRRRMDGDPVMQEWLRTCRAMQVALPGERSEPPSLWSPLPEVYTL